jgi:hypothetical protein
MSVPMKIVDHGAAKFRQCSLIRVRASANHNNRPRGGVSPTHNERKCVPGRQAGELSREF